MKQKKILVGITLLLTCIFNLFVGKNTVNAASDYTGHHSWDQLTTSNGLTAGIYSQKQGKFVRLQRHIYTHEDENSTTPNYMYDSYFGYRTDQKVKWLNDLPVKKAEYVNGTNIIHSVQNNENLTFDSYYVTPFSGINQNESSLLYMLVKVTNNGPTRQVSVFSQQNMHMGSDYASANEESEYNSQNNYIKEFNSKTGSFAIYKNLVSEGQKYQTGAGANTPVSSLEQNNHLNNTVTKSANDIVSGYENSNIVLHSGQSHWFGVIIGLREDGNEKALSQDIDANAKTALNKSPQALLQQEENWWQKWHKNEKMPQGMTVKEKRTYLQSTAVLKMSQVRDKGAGYGQVLASLIPGEWSIAWVRDGSYSIRALIDSGHYQEAKDALSFFLNAQMKKDSSGNNYYQSQYIENDQTEAPIYGLNTKLSENYLLSVCRYYGNGTEESDYNDHGPNIEFDGWGLVLWTINYYVKTTGDYQFLLNNKNIETAQGWIKRKQQIVDNATDKLANTKVSLAKKKADLINEKQVQADVIKRAKRQIQTAKGWIARKRMIVKTAKKALESARTKTEKSAAQSWLTEKQNELNKEIVKQAAIIKQAKQQIERARAAVNQKNEVVAAARQAVIAAKTWLVAKKQELTKEKAKQAPIIQTEIKNTNWYKITKRDADLLIELVDKKNGLLKQDSSIWEEHWDPYNVLKSAPARQQFAFTNITAWAGLNSAAEMARKLQFNDLYKKYSKAADHLKAAIMKQLVVTQDGQSIIASSLERKGDIAKQNDGSTVEAINMGLVQPDSKLARGMMAAFNQNLRIKTGHTPGFMRNQDGDLYDSREWGFIDLRIAGALSKMQQKGQAKSLIDWMTSQAEHNYDLIPELLDYNTQDYAGSVPMGGFGSGSYILALNDYYK